MSTRKKWATRHGGVGPYKRHESRAAAYRYVESQRGFWAVGMLRHQTLVVYVNNGDERGWQVSERIDLGAAA